MHEVTFNGRKILVAEDVLTFDIIRYWEEGFPTVSYENGENGASGSLCPGQSVKAVQGMIINAIDTSAA
jgi:hypothetical protein